MNTAQGLVANVAGDRLVALLPQSDEESARATVEILEVSGPAFYSQDRDAIRRHRFLEARESSAAEQAALRNAQAQDLVKLQWRPLAEGQMLRPWDMVWTQNDGRVEIQVLEPQSRIIGEWTAVLDSHERRTGKNRLMSNMYFIMAPPYSRSAMVNKVVGHVLMAADPDEVRAFFDRYKRLVSFLGLLDERLRAEWQEMLRKPDLE